MALVCTNMYAYDKCNRIYMKLTLKNYSKSKPLGSTKIKAFILSYIFLKFDRNFMK